MIELKQGYDSARACTCDWCKAVIPPLEDKVLYGTGNSLLVVLHTACDPEFGKFWFVPLRPQGAPFKNNPGQVSES